MWKFMLFSVYIFTNILLLNMHLIGVFAQSPLIHEHETVTLDTYDGGTFIGMKKSVDMGHNEIPKAYFEFKGIPYAEAPVGPLRWKGPKLTRVTRTPIQATHFRSICPQWDPQAKAVIGDEDCLFLNIFTPYIPRRTFSSDHAGDARKQGRKKSSLLPVIVYVHEGNYLVNSGNSFGGELLIKENVILVTFNYRLGLLGFFHTFSEMVGGNYGLLDQISALTWIKKRIHRFGGNPAKVTLVGNVEYLIMSPRTTDLFSKAIILYKSGSSLTAFRKFEKTPKNDTDNDVKWLSSKITDLITHNLKCPAALDPRNEEKIEVMLKCLEVVDFKEIINIQHVLQEFHAYPRIIPTIPVADVWRKYPVLPGVPGDNPENFDAISISNIPIIIGVSTFEGFNMASEVLLKLGKENIKNDELLKSYIRESLVNILFEQDKDNLDDRFIKEVTDIVLSYYFDTESKQNSENFTGNIGTEIAYSEGSQTKFQRLVQLFGDLTCFSGFGKFVEFLVEKGASPVYAYVFNFTQHSAEELAKNRLKIWSDSDLRESLLYTKPQPWDEEYYLFRPLILEGSSSPKFSPSEHAMSSKLMKLFISFVKYGSTKPGTSSIQMDKWKPTKSSNSVHYYLIHEDRFQMRSNFRKTETNFWTNTVPEVEKLSSQITRLSTFPLLFWMSVVFLCLFFVATILLVVVLCNYTCTKDATHFDESVIFLSHKRTT